MIEPQQVTIYCAAYDGTSGLSHRLLRQAAQLSAPAQTDLTLASGTHGKPYFLHAPQLHFNLSHSGRHWLCAFSGAPVGLDVQQHRACQKQALARRFFSPTECASLDREGKLSQVYRRGSFRSDCGLHRLAGLRLSVCSGRAFAAAAAVRGIFRLRLHRRPGQNCSPFTVKQAGLSS